jgi:hypothetical protein
MPVPYAKAYLVTMRMLYFLAWSILQRRVANELHVPPFLVEPAVSAKEHLQFAREGSDASLCVFARNLDLDQGLGLFEAGVDECVCEPFVGPTSRTLRSRGFAVFDSFSIGLVAVIVSDV